MDSVLHYCDVIMTAMASQITSLTILYLIVYSGADQRKHQSPAWLAFVKGIHRRPVNSPHKWPVKRKMIPFDDVIMLKKECENVARRILSPWMAFSSYGSCQLPCGIRFMISELTSLWYMFCCLWNAVAFVMPILPRLCNCDIDITH